MAEDGRRRVRALRRAGRAAGAARPDAPRPATRCVEVSTAELPDDWDVRWQAWHRPVELAAGGRACACARRGSRADRRRDRGRHRSGAGVRHRRARDHAALPGAAARARAAGGPLADWGCGSGVLAVGGAKLGFAPVLACDVEVASVEATRAAALGERRGGRGGAGRPAAHARARGRRRSAPTSCARCCSRSPRGSSARRRALIASGLLREEAGEVVAAFAPPRAARGGAARRAASGARCC